MYMYMLYMYSVCVTGSEKTDHFVIMEIAQYGPKALPRSQSRDFAISMLVRHLS